MKDGFVKIAAVSPAIRLADPAYNVIGAIQEIERAHKRGVAILVMPELGLTGATCGDLFRQQLLLEKAEQAVFELAKATGNRELLVVAGAPLRIGERIYNCAVVLCAGEVRGIVPSNVLPRQPWFAAPPREQALIQMNGQQIPFGTELLFGCTACPGLVLGVVTGTGNPEMGAELARLGATIIANPYAEPEWAGGAARRRTDAQADSRRWMAGYIRAGASMDESTTDGVYAAHNIIAEMGSILEEALPLEKSMVLTELDIQRIVQRRAANAEPAACIAEIVVPIEMNACVTDLTRRIAPHPFVPDEPAERAERCRGIFAVQCAALERRLAHTGARKLLIGVSGGLDSTLAMLVAAGALARMNRPANDLIGVTMPCFGTTGRTRGNAERLTKLLEAEFRTIDITESVQQHLADLRHTGESDIAFENAQARERTQVLMDLANMENGLVVGTGNLSELALGWCTYNGDHMSMYAVNAGVPKTLVRALVDWQADVRGGELGDVLRDILDTPVSPELLPPSNGEIIQQTESVIGPYELHDFFLYFYLRWGFSPAKIRRLAAAAFAGRYDDAAILKWLTVFARRFVSQQFKRSCSPDGPAVGSVSLSPRAGYRMPSDASAELWIREITNMRDESV